MAPRENTKNKAAEESRIQLRLREIQVMKELKQMELEEIRMQRKQLEENVALQHTQANHDQDMIEQNKAQNEKPDEHVLDPVPDVSSRSTTAKTKEKTMASIKTVTERAEHYDDTTAARAQTTGTKPNLTNEDSGVTIHVMPETSPQDMGSATEEFPPDPNSQFTETAEGQNKAQVKEIKDHVGGVGSNRTSVPKPITTSEGHCNRGWEMAKPKRKHQKAFTTSKAKPSARDEAVLVPSIEGFGFVTLPVSRKEGSNAIEHEGPEVWSTANRLEDLRTKVKSIKNRIKTGKRVAAIVAKYPDQSTDELVANKVIMRDQKVALDALSEVEETLTQYNEELSRLRQIQEEEIEEEKLLQKQESVKSTEESNNVEGESNGAANTEPKENPSASDDKGDKKKRKRGKKGKKPITWCAMCDRETRFRCPLCQGVSYCAPGQWPRVDYCRKLALPMHSLICAEYKEIKKQERPSEDHYLALLFPERGARPKLVWVLAAPCGYLVVKDKTEKSGEKQVPLFTAFKELLDVDDQYPIVQRTWRTNHMRMRDIGHDLHMVRKWDESIWEKSEAIGESDDKFEELLNKSIHAALQHIPDEWALMGEWVAKMAKKPRGLGTFTKKQALQEWIGPILVYRTAGGENNVTQDVDCGDFLDAVECLLMVGNFKDDGEYKVADRVLHDKKNPLSVPVWLDTLLGINFESFENSEGEDDTEVDGEEDESAGDGEGAAED